LPPIPKQKILLHGPESRVGVDAAQRGMMIKLYPQVQGSGSTRCNLHVPSNCQHRKPKYCSSKFRLCIFGKGLSLRAYSLFFCLIIGVAAEAVFDVVV